MSDAMYAAASLYNDPRFFSTSEIRIRNNRIRRQRIYRRQLSMLIGSIMIILFSIIFMKASLNTNAQSDTYKPEFKYYTAIIVHSGDTLWDIASEHFSPEHYDDVNAYISEIAKLNKMDTDYTLKAEESLIIPYYSSEFKWFLYLIEHLNTKGYIYLYIDSNFFEIWAIKCY